MAEAVFSFDCNFGATHDGFSSASIDNRFYQVGASMEEDFYFSKYQREELELESYMGYKGFADQVFDIISPPFQTALEEIAIPDKNPGGNHQDQDVSESKKTSQRDISLASLELLKKYENYGRLNGARIIEPSSGVLYTKPVIQELSTEEVIRIAGTRFIQSSSQMIDVASALNNPFSSSFSDFSCQEAKNVELVEFLLASAEKVGNQQYERATRLLSYCETLSSSTGNSVQRVVYYFTKALQERLGNGTGRISSECYKKNQFSEVYQEMATSSSAGLACLQKIPFYQAARFAAIQAIVEKMAGETRVHIIDLEIRNGAQWSVLMQALSCRHDCPIELLKITAVGTASKQLIDDTGKRLASFAKSMNIPFTFKVVMVSDTFDLNEDLLEIDTEEAVAIYSEYLFMNLIFEPTCLESVIKVLRNINPQIMVVMEVEANTNSPSFSNRFIEALFYYSAYFDCFDACMNPDDPNRMITEMIFFQWGIRPIVTNEGDERRSRHVKIDVWRSFFARFGIMETQLSHSSIYQASLMFKQFECGNYCMLDMNEKSLILGWKGSPILSVSAWNLT